MVTTTTKTLNYSITKGNQTNSVNATITSTPGFNSNYLGKLPGILHFLELLLAAISFGLIIALRKESRVRLRVEGTPAGNEELSYLHELLLIGDVYFISAHSAVLTFLIILLIAYLFHTTTAMIIPKATTLENVAHLVLALLLLAAGILQIIMTVNWKWEDNSPNARRLIFDGEFGQRLAAGAIAILNAILFIVSLVMSRKELAGPKAL